MIAVLTGDIKNSTAHSSALWLPLLKGALDHYGKEPSDWEIYRGDSFQLKTAPEMALEASIHIKASLKQIRHMDVRIAIGLGKQSYRAEKLTESNGEAFVNSGQCFETLKKYSLAIKGPDDRLDHHINLLLELALLTMDHWTPAQAKTVKTALEHPQMNQNQLASLLKKSQGNISEELKKAGFEEVKKMIQFYRTKIQGT